MQKGYKKWTDREVDYLRNNYLTMSAKEIAKVLDRTEASVALKRRLLGLRKGRKPPPPPSYKISKNQIPLLKKLYLKDKLSLREIGKILGCGHRTIRLALIRFGVPLRDQYEGFRTYYYRYGAKVMEELNKTKYSEEEKRLLALAIDLEGAIALTKRKKGNRLSGYVQVANTSKAILDYIYRLARIGRVSRMVQYKGNRKRVGHWTISDFFRMKFFLENIEPYLIAKREQARLMIKFCESRINNPRAPYTEDELEIYQKMKMLNRRGRVDYGDDEVN